MRYILLLSLLLFSNIGATENNESNKATPEDLLIKTLNKISTGDLNTAIKDINVLIKKVPNFRLAHLIHGDLLSARTQNINTFGGDAYKTNPDAVNDLKTEASKRIKSYLYKNDKLLNLNLNIQLDIKYKYLIFIDVKNSRLFTFKNNKGKLSYNTDHYISIGKKGFYKKIDGDKKTPVGVYFLKNKIKRKLPDLYGAEAYTLNYPNDYDKIRKYTGSGIWIHGVPKETYVRAPQASDGCIVLSNQDLKKISHILNTKNTPVIISNHGIIKFNNRDAMTVAENKKNILNIIQNWKNDWVKGNFDNYISHYAPAATYNHQSYLEWTIKKKKVLARSNNIQIALNNISVFEYPNQNDNLLLVDFYQHYKSSLITSKTHKTQIWIKKNKDWKIVYEGNFE